MSPSTDTFPPNITAPAVFMSTVGINSTYSFLVTDGISVSIMVNGQFELPSNVQLTNLSNEDHVLTWIPLDVSEELNITIVALGSRNVSSVFNPHVQLCGCVNNGSCTEAGVLNLQLHFIVLNCECPPGKSCLFIILQSTLCGRIKVLLHSIFFHIVLISYMSVLYESYSTVMQIIG